jgi:chromosome segregation ATPase
VKNGQPKQVELTETERLSEIERKFEYIRGKISEYDKILTDFKELKQSLIPLSQKPDQVLRELKEFQNEIYSNLRNIKTQNNDTWKGLEFQSNRVSGYQTSLVDLINKFEASIDELHKQINFVAEQAPSFSKGKADKKEIEEAKTLLSDQIIDHRTRMGQFEVKLGHIQEEIKAIVDSIHEKDDTLDEHSRSIMSINLFCNSVESKLEKKFSQFADASNANEKDAREFLRKALADAKTEIIGTPSSNAAVEARIMNRLEMATLDGSNAVTIARQMSEKISLLEKKIDKMQLQLKKFETPK